MSVTVTVGGSSSVSVDVGPKVETAGVGLTKVGDRFDVFFGAQAGTVAEGDDPRLSDARVPVDHTHVEADITDLSMDPIVAALLFGGT